MKRSLFSEEQIVYAIGQAGSGNPIGEPCRQVGGQGGHLLHLEKEIRAPERKRARTVAE